MSGVLGFVKQNIWIVLLTIVTIAILPTAYIFSSGWNKSLREDLEKRANEAFRSVDVSVEYRALQIDPTADPISTPGVAPNPRLNEFYRDLRTTQQEQLETVISRAEEFNQRGREPLVEGLFPEPEGTVAQAETKRIAMGEQFTARKADNAYQRLLDSINAGPPVEIPSLMDQIDDLVARREDEREAELGAQQQMDEEAKAALQEDLVDLRLGAYASRASEISVYADMGIFPALDMSFKNLPQVHPNPIGRPPPIRYCYVWQHDYWVLQDVFDAIRAMNTDDTGEMTTVTNSLIKRIISLRIDGPLVFPDGGDPQQTAVTGPDQQEIKTDYGYSVTGRYSDPDNRLYDVRLVDLSVVTEMARLPELFDGLAKTNFITVIGFDMNPVDLYSDLNLGYYYGEERVVRADLKLEVLLLRSWTEPLMPDNIRSRLGLPPRPADNPTGETPDGDR
jgi:hypothetical protein